MLRLLADQNFNMDVVRGVRRRLPSADIVNGPGSRLVEGG
jgi:hypothetical protein